MRFMERQERWDAAKEAINALLGLGFGNDHTEAQNVWSEIDGDFGVPTESDIDDFVNVVTRDLDPEYAPSRAAGAAAIDGCVSVLRLYRCAAFDSASASV